MPESPMTTAAYTPPGIARALRLQSLPHRTYRLRVLGMGLASLPLMTVLWELHAGWLAWVWVGLTGLLWPHVAYALARRSRDPLHAELRNFVIDSALAGSWAPLMHFNLLPSVMLLTTVMADKNNVGVRGLWRRSLPGTLAAIGIGSVLTGFAWHPHTSMAVILATLPIMIIHAMAVSLSSYRLVRRVQAQNRQLEALTRRDALTDLDSRSHWHNQAENLLAAHHVRGQAATLLVLDADDFKDINDRYGHAAGDDVLRAIAAQLRIHLRADSHAGRLGGDEFAVAMPASLVEAQAAAERLRAAIEAMRFPLLPELRCSVSIGIAAPPARGLALRDWIEVADRALYRAKHAGRNRTAVGEPAVATGT